MAWSPPCAIGTVGISWGALVGAQLTDHVFLLMTDAAVDIMSSNKGSFTLGADIGVALGPLGRSAEADVGASPGRRGMEEVADGPGGVELAPIYTYSLSKGFYAGVSLDGKVIVTRHRINENFYGQKVDSGALLSGGIPTPPAAQPLYDALKRCHIYATNDD
jgi:lipid-binding SYLF domain-containing protein